MEAGGREHKLFLYADDILCLVSDPASSTQVLLNKVDLFSQISGYKVNWHKPEAMAVSKVCHPAMVSAGNFKWLSSGMKYLGVRLCTNIMDVMHINMTPLLAKIKNSLEKWKTLNLTLWGKINTVKMVIAPQFNYLSMMLPLSIPGEFFTQYNRMIKDYLWNGKRAKINLQKLYMTRSEGGLSLPNVELYNIAFKMDKLAKHCKQENEHLGWVGVE